MIRRRRGGGARARTIVARLRVQADGLEAAREARTFGRASTATRLRQRAARLRRTARCLEAGLLTRTTRRLHADHIARLRMRIPVFDPADLVVRGVEEPPRDCAVSVVELTGRELLVARLWMRQGRHDRIWRRWGDG